MQAGIRICSGTPLSPLFRNVLRTVAMLLGHKACFGDGEGTSISYEGRSVCIGPGACTGGPLSSVCFKGEEYSVFGGRQLTITETAAGYTLSHDILTPLLQLATLQSEESLVRDDCGLAVSRSDVRFTTGEWALFADVLLGFTRLLGAMLGLEGACLVTGQASKPYTVVVSFDVDGYFPGQIKALQEHIAGRGIQDPTFMVMACIPEEKTLYDPVYDLYDDELQTLFSSECDIGLHSSYLAHDDPAMLRAQKNRLEQACGRPVKGHRSHYYRFAYPRSWGHCIEAGFLYDASLGWPDRAGLRNGSSVPLPLYHPDGFDSMLWYLPTGILDQHLSMQGAMLCWKEKGQQGIDSLLDGVKRLGGVLVLDWHVHGFDNEQFPGIFEPFDYILERAAADNALLCGFQPLVERFANEWNRLYEDELSLARLVRKAQGVVRSEVEKQAYYDVFAAANENVVSVQRAADSLLCSLPVDAEKILDIGSGSGLMNRRIPPFYKVICCDLSDEILSMTGRPSVVGDILDIPLRDNAVTMSVACDVLEHLSPQELHRAVDELARVSEKYLYLQVPLEEKLGDGTAVCSSCGNRWHVNFHKNSFSEQSLISLIPKGWNLREINYTGDIQYENRSFSTACSVFGQNTGAVEGVTCLKCGCKLAHDGARWQFPEEYYKFTDTVQTPAPRYTEIGVLLEKGGCGLPDMPLRIRKGHYEKHSLQTNRMDFTKPFLYSWTLNYAAAFPIICANSVYFQKTDCGLRLVASGRQAGIVTFAFPFRWGPAETVVIEGEAKSEGAILYVFGCGGDLLQLFDSGCPGSTVFGNMLHIPKECAGRKAVLQLLVPAGGECLVRSIFLNTKKATDYCAYVGGTYSFNHFEYTLGGVMRRFALPSDGKLFVDAPLQAYSCAPRDDSRDVALLRDVCRGMCAEIEYLRRQK